MATDPVRRIRKRHLGHSFDLALDGVLAEIVALPPNGETPYVTVTVDWTPQGSNPGRSVHEAPKASQRGRVDPASETSANRPARTELRSLGEAALSGLEQRSAARESVEADLALIAHAIEHDLPNDASGAIFVANHGAGVFIMTPLGMPVETSLSVGTTPAIRSLVRLVEDNEPYGVLVSDQHAATLTFFVQHLPLDEVAVISNGWPRKQSSGGLNQQRYQTRADERVEAKAKVVADEVRSALAQNKIEKLVVANSSTMSAALDAAWHDDVRTAILDSIAVAPDATLRDLADREDEMAAVVEVEDAIGQETLGRSGAEAVARVLSRGQVALLVMNDDFAASGWIDPGYAVAGVGDIPAEHPAGGDVAGMLPVNFADEFIRMAVGQGARVEIVHTRPLDAPSLQGDGSASRSEAAARLDALGGVGVVLRFSLLPNE
jgi:hypothetical protein